MSVAADGLTETNTFSVAFQTALRMAMPILPYREPETISTCLEFGKVVEKEKIAVLTVTDKGILNNGLVAPVKTTLGSSSVSYCIYADMLLPATRYFYAMAPYLILDETLRR